MLSFQKQSCWFCSLSPRIDMAADLRCDRRIQPRYGWTLKESGLSTNRYYWGLSTIHYWRSHQGRVPGISIIAVAMDAKARTSPGTPITTHVGLPGFSWQRWNHIDIMVYIGIKTQRVSIYIYISIYLYILDIYIYIYIYSIYIYIYARVCKLIFTPPAWLPESPLVDLSMVQWWCWPIQLDLSIALSQKLASVATLRWKHVVFVPFCPNGIPLFTNVSAW